MDYVFMISSEYGFEPEAFPEIEDARDRIKELKRHRAYLHSSMHIIRVEPRASGRIVETIH